MHTHAHKTDDSQILVVGVVHLDGEIFHARLGGSIRGGVYTQDTHTHTHTHKPIALKRRQMEAQVLGQDSSSSSGSY